MPYSLDKEVSQDKGIAVNRNAITALDTRLTIAESTLADVDAHAIRDDITADQNMVGQLIITKDAYPLRLAHTTATSFVEATLANDIGQSLVMGSVGSTYVNPDWAGSTYVYNTGAKNMWIKSQQELGFFTGGTSLANKRLRIDAAGIATFTNAVTVNGTLSADGGLSQDGHNILNGSDTWLRTNGNQGWYSATYGGGIRMADANYVEIYGAKKLKVTATANDSITTTGGLFTSKAQNNGVVWTNSALSIQPVQGTTNTTGRTTIAMGASTDTAGYGYSLNVHRTSGSSGDPAFHINHHNNSASGTEKLRITPTKTTSYNNLDVYNTAPILVIQDSNSTGNAATGYMEFRDSANTRHGWMGFGSASNDLLTINNDANSTTGVLINGNVAWHAGNTICYSGQMGSAMTSPTGPVVLKFNEIWVNKGGITYDGATGKFTVPETGIYRVTINPFKRTGAGSTGVMVGVNTLVPTATTHRGYCYTNETLYSTMCINSVISLTAGDYIVFYLSTGGLYNLATDKFNQYSIERIG